MSKINDTIKNITELDYNLMAMAQSRLDNLTKPKDSLGRLEELAKLIVGITGKENPVLKNKVIFTFASDHGVAEEKVSAFPQEVTEQMVYNFIHGGAGVNVLARHIGAKVIVADLGVAGELKIKNKSLKIKKINGGTKNMTKCPAMTQDEAIKSIETGIEIFEQELNHGIDIIGIGEMGIANTTASTAITAVWTKKAVEEITGRGTGINNNGLENKIRVIKQALEINRPNPSDPIDVLSKVGGFEIGGLAGVI
ncbi:MAG: nicotinate-nucleotide--dimethylbenzimidazole phosphoribosyltransferase, partial [Candidatus Omnitrophota bacterium]